MRGAGPPWIALRVIAQLATRAEADHLLGDLEEGYADRVATAGERGARRWYWRQALVLVAGLVWLRLRSALSPSRLTRELRFALLSFRRTPGVGVAAVVTLGIGISAPTTMFGIVDGMYTRLPADDAASVVDIRLVDRTRGTTVDIPASLLRTWRETALSVTPLGGYRGARLSVSGDSMSPARVASAEVTPEVLSLLGVRPVVGRLFTRDDEPSVPGVLIREDRWEQWYDRWAGVLGARVRVGGRDHVIVGVLPRDFGFPITHDVWTRLDATAEPDRTLRVVGRLAAGVSAQAARTELEAILRRLGPSAVDADVGDIQVSVDEYVLAVHGREGRTMFGYVNLIVSLLVVIAAANVAALFLARGVARSSEFAVRMAIGAGRARIVRQLLLEALLLATGGALVGLVVAQAATHWFVHTAEARGALPLPYWADFGLKPSTFVFVSALMFLATFVAGLLPSLHASRIDLVAVMKGGGPQGRETLRTLPWLVGAEVMFSCMLLILSGLAVKAAFASVQRVGAFPLANVVTGQFVLEEYDYPAVSDRARFYDALRTALDGRAEVESYTLATAMPGDGTTAQPVMIEGQPTDRDDDRPLVQVRHVEPSFFAMFGMHTLAGRTFERADDDGAARVVVVNEAWARQLATIGDVVGRRVTIDLPSEGATDYQVVGVVSDPGVSVDDGRRVPAVFVPVAQTLPPSAILAVRTFGGVDVAREIMSREVHRIDADLPLTPILTLESIVRRENDGGRLFGSLFAALGLSALLLAMVGLYGVVAFTTERRTRDIGIMRALGAFEHALVRSTTLRALRPVMPAIVLGLTAAWMVGPQINGISLEFAHDPYVFTVVPAVLLICAVVAAFLPASRAARVDPLRALRVD